MIKTKLNLDKNSIIVKKVAVMATLKNIPHDTMVRFAQNELGHRDSTVRAAIFRLNEIAGKKEYIMTIDEQNGDFLIKRL